MECCTEERVRTSIGERVTKEIIIMDPADGGSARARGDSWVTITTSLTRMFLVALLLLTPVVRGEAADQKASVRKKRRPRRRPR